MKSNFDEFNQPQQSGAGIGRDRFELLSAYLDGEVTPAERRQVQQWLDTDPQIQQLYVRLLRLHETISHLPLPPAEISSQQLSAGVFQAVGRRRRFAFWGGVTAATLVVGLLSHLLLGTDSPTPNWAGNPQPSNQVEAEPLMIALHQPAIEIPAEETHPTPNSSKVREAKR